MTFAPDRIRRFEYTGDNRCWPCTYTNVALLGLLAAAVAVVSLPGALVAAVVGGLGIWLRGYLIPFTPRFAPRLVRRLPWDPFHAQRTSDSIDSVDDIDREAVVEGLVEAGVIRVSGEDVELDPSFETSWYDEMDRLASLPDDDLAEETVAVSPGATDVSVHTSRGYTHLVLTDGSGELSGESWLRRPVAVAETAGVLTLREWGVAPEQSVAAAGALGLFLQTCPACGGTVTEQPAGGGCCGPPDTGPDGEVLQARVCESCEVRYHVIE
ncbi:MAG: hypothetical protein ABEH66_03105 [Halobacteriales archaeon]